MRFARDADAAALLDPSHPVSYTHLVVQTNPINLHSKADKLIAVSLPMFEERCRQRGIQAPPMDDLKQLLRSSKSRRFLAAKNVKTRLENKVIHCWVFAQPEGRDDCLLYTSRCV